MSAKNKAASTFTKTEEGAPKTVATHSAICDGKAANSLHPKVYLRSTTHKVHCPYCGTIFKLPQK